MNRLVTELAAQLAFVGASVERDGQSLRIVIPLVEKLKVAVSEAVMRSGVAMSVTEVRDEDGKVRLVLEVDVNSLLAEIRRRVPPIADVRYENGKIVVRIGLKLS